MEKQWAEAWKQACKAYAEDFKNREMDEFHKRFEELMRLYGDPNVPPPQGTAFANQDTEVAKAARREFNS